VRLKQLQLLCHQSKIPSKIELFIYLPDMTSPIENNEFRYKKLGYIGLDTNERSNYQARELKSVFLDNPCLYMKLVFHKCHINKYNLFNQVSLIALSVFGDPLAINEEVQKNIKGPAGMFDKLEYETQFDPTTLDRLKVLETAKEKAIKSEDYENAKRLKDAIERLKQIGVQLQHMEERKLNAVSHDDYESAKIIKAEIDRLRSAIMPEALMGKYGYQSTNQPKGDLPPVQYNSHRPLSGAIQQNLPISPITQVMQRNEPMNPNNMREITEENEKRTDNSRDNAYQKPNENPFQKKKSEQEIENRSEIVKEKDPNDFMKKAVKKDLLNNHDEQVLPAGLIIIFQRIFKFFFCSLK
jgi:centrosomal protein CEP104